MLLTILQQMVTAGYTSDSEMDTAIRQLAVWEDAAEQGPVVLDPDQLAAIRHYIQYSSQPTAE